VCVVRMPRVSRLGQALGLGVAAVLTLVGFGILAALPGLPDGLRLSAVVAGYVAFVIVFRAGMVRWRADWNLPLDSRKSPDPRVVPFARPSRSKRRDGPFVIFVLSIFAFAGARKTMLAVPSAEMVDERKTRDEVWPADSGAASPVVAGIRPSEQLRVCATDTNGRLSESCAGGASAGARGRGLRRAAGRSPRRRGSTCS